METKINLDNISVNAQSSIRIQGALTLYFDPFSIEDGAHDADIILVTHEHFDHFDPESIAKIAKENTLFVAPESMKKKALKESGISEDKCVFYQPGTVNELEGISIETIPAYNVMKPFHMKSSKWFGYKVTMDGISYYVAGDTDVNEDVKKVSCDVALVPVGGHYTMNKKQAAELVLDMKPIAAIPTHYGKVVGDGADGDDFKKLVEAESSSIMVEVKLPR